MSDNILSLSEHTNDATMRSVEDALQDAINCIGKEGSFVNGKKVLILALDDTDGEYKITFIQAGLKMSECLGLCEVSKAIFLEQMGYV